MLSMSKMASWKFVEEINLFSMYITPYALGYSSIKLKCIWIVFIKLTPVMGVPFLCQLRIIRQKDISAEN